MDKQILVVEAAAGSGKTYALARRYLKLLLNALVQPEGNGLASDRGRNARGNVEAQLGSTDRGRNARGNVEAQLGSTFSQSHQDEKEALSTILAITFMKKAAVEMKERILELLKQLALDTFQNKNQKEELLAYIGLDEKSCRQTAFRAMREIIRRYDYFQVQTIDSFINSLLLGCAFRLGLSANFNILQDYNKYIASSFDQLLDLAGEEKEVKKLFLDFVWHYLSVENRGGWLAKNDILSIIKLLFSEFNRFGVGFSIYPKDDEDIFAKKKEIYRQIVKINKKIDCHGINKAFVKGVKDFVKQNGANFQLDNLKSASWQKEEIPGNKGFFVPAEFNKEWSKLRLEIKELCEMEAYSLFNPYIRIFNRVFEFFLKQSQKKDVLFLEELNSRARQLFGKGVISVPEIYYRIGSRFRHFLIDEFQDTSILQWDNIFILAEEALSTGGTLFYVGDKKQAIYRFRGGEVELFDGVKKELAQFGLPEENVLRRNYRSAKEIVQFNNNIFSSQNLKRFIANYETYFKFSPAFEQELLRIFLHSQQESQSDKPGGYVRVERLDILSENIVREKLLEVIKDLRARSFDFKDIAILCRSGVLVEEISGWLIEEGFSVESEKTLNIRENSLIKEVTSFLKFLDSPIDDLSFAFFILGEIFRAASGISKEKIADFIFRNRIEKKKEDIPASYLYRAFEKEFLLSWQRYIEKFFKNVGFLPLYEMVVTIYADFGVLEKFPENQSFFMSFLELVKKKEDECNGIKEFLEYFKDAVSDDFYVKFSASNAVKVMTVHKAKGREFPVVIIPFPKINPRAESTSSNYGASYTIDRKGNILRLLRLKENYRKFSSQIQARYDEEYFSSFLDELNNIYVSFTRAKQELYIFVPKSPGAADPVELLIPWLWLKAEPSWASTFPRAFRPRSVEPSWASTFPRAFRPRSEVKRLPSDLDDFLELGGKTEQSGAALGIDEPRVLSPSRYSNWIDMLKDEFKDYSQLKQIKKGEAAHYIFSFLGNLFNKDPDVELSRCLKLGQSRFPEFKDFAELETKIKIVLKDPRFKDLFFCEDGRVFTEKEVINRFGDTKRIDRLILKDKEAIIVDFKSGLKEEGRPSLEAIERERDDKAPLTGHVKQVKEYIELIQAIYPAKSVRGCLVYLDELWLKEVF